MSIEAIGCCGAYCGTCKGLDTGVCKGCKYGYLDGKRDIGKVKCKIKVCCIKNNYNSCADCCDFLSCTIINEFYSKHGYKYKKYKQAIEHIRNHGYTSFLEKTSSWNGAYGKYS